MVGAGCQPPGDGEPAVREDRLAGHPAPDLLQLVDAFDGRVHCDEACVERADRAAHDDVGYDARLEQRLQRAPLRGAETAATGEDHGLADVAGGPPRRRGGVTPSTAPERENRHVVPPTVAPPMPFMSARTVLEVSR